jgi:hypothetical protein
MKMLKCPARRAQVLRAAALHHRDVELARQAENREEAEHRERQVVRGGRFRPRLGKSGQGRRLARDVAETVEQAPGHERADGDESDQLHDRLERDGQHHAGMVLGRIHVARAEQNREKRQSRRDVDRGVADRGAARGRGQRVEGLVDRLQLQGDVRNDPAGRDQRDRDRERAVAPVARRDEIRDRGDTLTAADADQLREQRGNQQEQQDRTDVGRRERPAEARGLPDRSVERPRRAVDGERQRIDQRPWHRLAAGGGPAVPDPRDREQHAQVGKRDQGQQQWAGHRLSLVQRLNNSTASAVPRSGTITVSAAIAGYAPW